MYVCKLYHHCLKNVIWCHAWGPRIEGDCRGGEPFPRGVHAASTRRDKNTRHAWGRQCNGGLTLLTCVLINALTVKT